MTTVTIGHPRTGVTDHVLTCCYGCEGNLLMGGTTRPEPHQRDARNCRSLLGRPTASGHRRRPTSRGRSPHPGRVSQQLRDKLNEHRPGWKPAKPRFLCAAAPRHDSPQHRWQPQPAAAKKPRQASLRAARLRGGRRRDVDHQVDRILVDLRGEQFT